MTESLQETVTIVKADGGKRSHTSGLVLLRNVKVRLLDEQMLLLQYKYTSILSLGTVTIIIILKALQVEPGN